MGAATDLVKSYYGRHAAITNDSKNKAYNERVASAFGYSAHDLAAIPADANLGVSCGNPTATANLKEGETVVDLGSGAGLDVFLAASKVGPTGRAIGLDMTPEMLALANSNARAGNYQNVTFIRSTLPDIPLDDENADVVISNCVINLLPADGKGRMFAEIFRVLKKGGRVAVSDVLARKPLPDALVKDEAMIASCIGGASLVAEYEAWMTEAGFKDVAIVDTVKDLNVYKEGASSQGVGCCSGGGCGTAAVEYDLNEFVGAFQIYGIKPVE